LTENKFLLVMSTCPDVVVAEGLARAIVEAGHAACVNIVPAVRSVYLWQGTLQSGDEALMVIKATAVQFDGLRSALVAQHPYDVPEVVALEIADGHHPYLAWLADPTRTGADSP
jgi:periplasmic divalent cation tolerance protein